MGAAPNLLRSNVGGRAPDPKVKMVAEVRGCWLEEQPSRVIVQDRGNHCRVGSRIRVGGLKLEWLIISEQQEPLTSNTWQRGSPIPGKGIVQHRV